MANGIKIGNLDISSFKVGSGSDDCKVYLGDILLYPQSTPPTPVSSCYEIIPQPISQYASTTYDSVYSWSDAKWYMKNNLSQYEEYGIYDIVENISSATTYNGKLAVVGTTEYEYSGGSWVVVGTYEDASTTYEITDEDPYEYEGVELSTTFKIPYADVESIGLVDLRIRSNDGDELQISLDTGDGMEDYNYRDSEGNEYNGTITVDGEYVYLSLPSEAPQSIVIDSVDYWNPTPIHLIAGSKQVTVEYEEKDIPLGNVYDTVAEMEAVGCPTVGVAQYGVVGNDAYQFDGEDWNSVSNYKVMEKNADGKANVLVCNSSTDLVKAEAQPSYFGNITEAVIGDDCVTSISANAFSNCSSLTSCTIGSGVTSIGEGAFYNSGIRNITIPNRVESIGNAAFYDCRSLTSIVIPNGVTSINQTTFSNCASLTSCTIGSGVTTIGNGAFQNAGLVSLHIPSGVTSISANAFSNCSSLTSITVDSNNSAYDSRNNCNALIKTSTNELILGCGNTIIPNGVTTIGIAAFVNCSGLTGNFVIPNSVTTIGSNAFRPCSGLTSITIGTGIKSINIYAFYGCSSLTSITINATTPPTLQNANAFTNTNNCPIYVPCGSVDAYKAASGWSSLASRITCVQPKTLQWVTFSNGDTIPSDLDVYGVSGISQDLYSTYGSAGGGSGTYIMFEPSRNLIEYYVYNGEYSVCASGSELKTDPIEIIFSNRGCSDFINQGATVSGTIQLLIYA